MNQRQIVCRLIAYSPEGLENQDTGLQEHTHTYRQLSINDNHLQ